jgi:hypothetical protein
MTLHDTDTDTDTDTEVRGDGSEEQEPLRPPAPGGISMRPAMIVFGLAALILVVFITIAIVTSQAPAQIKHSDAAVGVPGVTLRAVPAAGSLSPIVTNGEPPNNILNAVSVPVGSVRISHQNNTAGAGQYDEQVTFSSADSQAAILAFYAADMKLQGWQVSDQGAAKNDPGALEVLGKLAGSDGYYWDMGATVNATTFSPGGPPRGTTHFTVRLFQEDDSD